MMDPPFGMELGVWDSKAADYDDFDKIFKGINKVAPDDDSTLLATYIYHHMGGDLEKAGIANGWPSRGTEKVIYNDQAQNAGGPRYTHAHNMAIFKWRGGPGSANWNDLPKHSRNRHTVEPLRNKIDHVKFGDKRLNNTQKCVANETVWVKHHTKPDDFVVVLFGGTGTGAVASLHAGRSVVCFEKCPIHWGYSGVRVMNYIANPAGELTEDLATAKFRPDGEEQKTEEEAKTSANNDGEASSSSSSSSPSPVSSPLSSPSSIFSDDLGEDSFGGGDSADLLCSVCALALAMGFGTEECSACKCKVHDGCGTAREGGSGMFICSKCKETESQVDGTELQTQSQEI